MRSARRCRSSIICRTARKDYRDLDRVYIPLDALAAAGIDVEALGARASVAGAAAAASHELATRTEALLQEGDALSGA